MVTLDRVRECIGRAERLRRSFRAINCVAIASVFVTPLTYSYLYNTSVSWVSTFAMLMGYLCGNFIGTLGGFSAGEAYGAKITLDEIGEVLDGFKND